MRLLSLSMNHGSQELPWLTGLWVAVASGLWLLMGPVPETLVFDRVAIANGEWWRLVTGHWVHSDGPHALWDIAALALIGGLLEGRGKRRLAIAASVGIVAVDACIWWWLPDLERYCGLSGMLNTLFIIALADLWQLYRHPVFPAAMLLLGGKLIAEMAAGQSVLVNPSWPGVPMAHVAGCLGGVVFWGIEQLGWPALRGDQRSV
jgi:rhomboid family GlyGly-CTERM serine protease